VHTSLAMVLENHVSRNRKSKSVFYRLLVLRCKEWSTEIRVTLPYGKKNNIRYDTILYYDTNRNTIRLNCGCSEKCHRIKLRYWFPRLLTISQRRNGFRNLCQIEKNKKINAQIH